jgi:hypothetical protein
VSAAELMTRLATSLDGTGFVFVRLAAGAAAAVGVAGAVRECWRWYLSYDAADNDVDDDAREGRASEPTARRVARRLSAWAAACLMAPPAEVPPRLRRAAELLADRNRALARLRATPYVVVRQLAAAGLDRAEIARRTGLSRDAVSMAIALRR